MKDYAEIFLKYNIEYSSSELYYKSGQLLNIDGWAFFIPVSENDFLPLIENLIPYFIDTRICFKIPRNSILHRELVDETCSLEDFGKIICVYPDQAQLQSVANKLLSITNRFQGNIVPSAIRLGDLLFSDYLCFCGECNFDKKHNKIKGVGNNIFPDKFPENVNWPFDYITSPHRIESGPGDLIHEKYIVSEVIRDSVKGKVLKASYLKGKFWKVRKFCILKGGTKGMCRDPWGRDIYDRLLWQEQLHNKLNGVIAIPKVFDRFQEGEFIYIVMEFIDGETLKDYQDNLVRDNSWLDIPASYKNIILNQILRIVEMVEGLHKEGYLHRDLTYLNFLVLKNGEIYFIDIELAFSVKDNHPNPPFPLGTPGFMSPEQEEFSLPDYSQDIYYLGTLILASISRVLPQKLDKLDSKYLHSCLMYFIEDEKIVNLIVSCLSEPSTRPKIDTLRKELVEIIKDNHESPFYPRSAPIFPKRIGELIQASLNNFANSTILNHNGYWTTLTSLDPLDLNRKVVMGLGSGIGGILHLIAQSKVLGFQVSILENSIRNNITYLKDNFNSHDLSLGLYNGSSGIAVGIVSALESELINLDSIILEFIQNSFSRIPTELGISEGIAGWGIALLKCRNYLDESFVKDRLAQCAKILIEEQESDGSWKLNGLGLSQVQLTGFEDGISGISWFLLIAGKFLNSNEVTNSAVKSLQWLISVAQFDGIRYHWTISPKTKEKAPMFSGNIGIALTFIKAFEVTAQANFKIIAEQILINRPPRITIFNDEFNIGLTGLGEVYLEAYRVFKADIWYERAEWIAGLYLNSSIQRGENAWWIQRDSNLPYMDLMFGNGSINHFLLKFLNPEIVAINFFGEKLI